MESNLGTIISVVVIQICLDRQQCESPQRYATLNRAGVVYFAWSTVCTDCVYRRNQMHLRVAVIGNGIGQVQRLSYLRDIQMKIEQGGV